MFRHNIAPATLGLFIIAITGCGADPGTGISEDVAETEEELVIGNWQGPYSNGDAGPNPFLSGPPAPVICEVLDQGWWHPGKLYAGKCHYQWGTIPGARYSATYKTLQNTWPSYTWITDPGYLPNNAVVSDAGNLAVCRFKPDGMEWSTGKVYLGHCYTAWSSSYAVYGPGHFQILTRQQF